MRILHTVEFYEPSVGGAQEVVRQISERLTRLGHEVTVATTAVPERAAMSINGVKIEEFAITGNQIRGYTGPTYKYQDFLVHGQFDVMMNYAAQQWTMDLAFPVLDRVPYAKVMIPCGFSGLYQPEYSSYFKQMPEIMRCYDHLVFHSDRYRDVEFARQQGLTHLSIIPNGASQSEFEQRVPSFRAKYGIPEDTSLILTVGNHTGLKGHRLLIEAFRLLEIGPAVLVIIGSQKGDGSISQCLGRPLIDAIRQRQFIRSLQILGRTALGGLGTGCLPECRSRARRTNWFTGGEKRILLLDPPRLDVVGAFRAADLFAFASRIEYSPLVLFEAMASRTPFVTTACGNAEEIVSWSQGGLLVESIHNPDGTVDADPQAFVDAIERVMKRPDLREELGQAGHRVWRDRFTWEHLAQEYEVLYQRLQNT